MEEDNFTSFIKHISFPPLNAHQFIFLGVLYHPPDVLIVIEVIAKGDVPVWWTEWGPHEFDGFEMFFERVVLHDIQCNFFFASLIVSSVDYCVLFVFDILDGCEIAVFVVLFLWGGDSCVSALWCLLVVFFGSTLPKFALLFISLVLLAYKLLHVLLVGSKTLVLVNSKYSMIDMGLCSFDIL